MWLLHVERLTLKRFDDPSKVRYAILSHVWRDHEQTFQDIRSLPDLCTAPGDTPWKFLSPKIQGMCHFARKQGFEWVWVDTCCIDKTSSAELSEAINSMYDWYTLAAVCYAYLDDALGRQNPREPSSLFWRCKWFTRIWTLQELIAPRSIVFLSQDWRIIGTKRGLADVIEELTGVDRAVLNHECALDAISVARRMSWASRRQASREEDLAYALMGIFDVHMPAIYGEGRHSFLRLQEEILKQYPDQSIFAWGQISPNFPAPPDDMHADYEFREQREAQTLLASSPSAFIDCSGITSIPLETLAQRLGIPIRVPEYTTTSYGIRTHIPLIAFRRTNLTEPSEAICVAVLACQDAQSNLIGLYLRCGPQEHRRWFVGTYTTNSDNHEREYCRGILLHPSSTHLFRSRSHKSPLAQVTEVYIHHRDICASYARRTVDSMDSPVPCLIGRYTPPCRIIFPGWLSQHLAQHGFLPSMRIRKLLTFRRPGEHYTFAYENAQSRQTLTVSVGVCSVNPPWGSIAALWASAQVSYPVHTYEQYSRPSPLRFDSLHTPLGGSTAPAARYLSDVMLHNNFTQDTLLDCSNMHVERWENGMKDFGDDGTRVTLRFELWEADYQEREEELALYCLDIHIRQLNGYGSARTQVRTGL